ncbi:MAG: ribbon-helix-helix domain-containing protein [Bifidobacteriaceae bacterium]|nr:ribbon-helix-helix domain-containing protein [Bifidobacteriaceae bacterium]
MVDKMTAHGKRGNHGTVGGVPVTDQLVRASNDQVDERSPAGRERHPGRPSLSGDGESQVVQFRATRVQVEALDRRAKATHRTRSELAREALDLYLAGD